MTRRRAFTLLELLVVISIIALLISILLPSLSAARERGKAVQCLSNLRELASASVEYTVENECFPPCLDNYTASGLQPNNWGLDWLGIGNQSGGGYSPGNELLPNTGNPIGFSAAPKFGMLWKYYQNEKLVLCPSDQPSAVPGQAKSTDMIPTGNGKFSYSMLAGMGMRLPSAIPAAKKGNMVSASRAPLFAEENPASWSGQGGINQFNMEGNCWNVDRVVQRHAPFLVRWGRAPTTGGPLIKIRQGVTQIGFADGHSEALQMNYGANETDLTSNAELIPNNVKGMMQRFGVLSWTSDFAENLERFK